MGYVPVTGIEGRGRAGVFGGSINPLQVYLQHRAGQQKRQDLMLQYQLEQRDKLLDDYEKWNKDKAWEPISDEVNQLGQAARNQTREMLRSGRPVQEVRQEAARMFGEVNVAANKSMGIKEEYFAAIKDIEDDDEYDEKAAKSRLRNVIYRDDAPMQARFMADINTTKFQDVFNDPSTFNKPLIAHNFMTKLPTLISANETEYMGELGEKSIATKISTKLGLQKDEKTGDYIIDPRTNKPMISMTDAVFNQALQNPKIATVLEAEVPDRDAAKQREYLAKWLGVYDPASIEKNLQSGHRNLDADRRYSFNGRNFRTPIPDLVERDDRYEEIVTNYRPDLLSSLQDPNSTLKAYYTDAAGNPVKPGEKPAKIVMSYFEIPEGTGGKDFMQQIQNMDLAKVALLPQMRGRVTKKNDYDLSTAEGRRTVKIAMSLRQDQFDPKRSYGEDYPNFIEAKYQDQLKKNDKTTSGLTWK